MSAPSFDELLVRLIQADVRFVVIGGLALGSWGVVRGTKDCDIVPDPEQENLARLAHVVFELAICALEHLRRMKRAAGRPRDLVDLDDLDAAQPGGD